MTQPKTKTGPDDPDAAPNRAAWRKVRESRKSAEIDAGVAPRRGAAEMASAAHGTAEDGVRPDSLP